VVATKKQIHFIECLAIDLELDRQRRNAHVSEVVGREIKFLDELTISEACIVIDQLKFYKDEE
jgi:hypothetical protein